MNSKQVNEYIRDNYQTLSDGEIAANLSAMGYEITNESVRKRRRAEVESKAVTKPKSSAETLVHCADVSPCSTLLRCDWAWAKDWRLEPLNSARMVFVCIVYFFSCSLRNRSIMRDCRA